MIPRPFTVSQSLLSDLNFPPHHGVLCAPSPPLGRVTGPRLMSLSPPYCTLNIGRHRLMSVDFLSSGYDCMTVQRVSH